MPTLNNPKLSGKTRDECRWSLEQKRSLLVALIGRSHVDSAVRQSRQTALQEVERALAALTDGTYGTCEGCGGPVGHLRLKWLPEARLCLLCEFL